MNISSSRYSAFALCIICLWHARPAAAQGLGEFAGINAGVAGLGAGVAAVDKGRMLKQGAAYVQESVQSQTKAINDCMQLDKQYEIKKDWQAAEKCLTVALQYIARRDGPGSVKSVPVLSKLVKVTEEQNKLDEAIGYQKTVLIFNKAGKVPIPNVTRESLVLGNLYVKKSDYVRAEPVLRDSIALEKPQQVKTEEYKKSLRVYGKVLRENKKVEEAAKIESELVALEAPQVEEAAGSVQAVEAGAATQPAAGSVDQPAAVTTSATPSSAATSSASASATTATVTPLSTTTPASTAAATPAAPVVTEPVAATSTPAASVPVVIPAQVAPAATPPDAPPVTESAAASESAAPAPAPAPATPAADSPATTPQASSATSSETPIAPTSESVPKP